MDPENSSPTAMDDSEWRTQLQPDSRQRIVNKIMETLKRHLPFAGQEGLQELQIIALRFEDKIYSAATSQSDYLRKISLKMLTMESKSQRNVSSSLLSNYAGNSDRLPYPGVFNNMQPEVDNQGHSVSIPLLADQSEAQSSASLSSSLPTVSGLAQTTLPHVVGEKPNMRNTSINLENSGGNSMGLGVPSNVFVISQGQMSGRQQDVPQQSLIQPTQLQSSQHAGMQASSAKQPSMMQSMPFSSFQQNQHPSFQLPTPFTIGQHPLTVFRQQQHLQHVGCQQQQQEFLRQQQLELLRQLQQDLLLKQQPQQIIGAQSVNSSMQTNHNSVHMLQLPKVSLQQETQQSATNLLPTQWQQSRNLTAQTGHANGGEWPKDVYKKKSDTGGDFYCSLPTNDREGQAIAKLKNDIAILEQEIKLHLTRQKWLRGLLVVEWLVIIFLALQMF